MTPYGASRFPAHPATRVTFLLGVRDHAGHRSLVVDLLKRARHAKLAGATAFEGHEGYGESGRVHRVHVLSDDRPVAVVIVDRPDRIGTFLDDMAGRLDGVAIVVDDVEIVKL